MDMQAWRTKSCSILVPVRDQTSHQFFPFLMPLKVTFAPFSRLPMWMNLQHQKVGVCCAYHVVGDDAGHDDRPDLDGRVFRPSNSEHFIVRHVSAGDGSRVPLEADGEITDVQIPQLRYSVLRTWKPTRRHTGIEHKQARGAIPENREIKKWKFSFFPSKTCIVDKFHL